MTGSMESFRTESWRVCPVLDVPDHFPPAVIFSLIDSDPRSKFRTVLSRMSQAQQEQKLELEPPLTPRLMRQGLLSAAWDSVFHDVPGDRVALLFRNGGRHVSSDAAGREVVYSVMIGGTEPAGTKWLVTRSTRFEDRPVCWCMPVDVEKGKNTDVTLTAKEMIDLETLDA